MVAGGTGSAPIRALLEDLAHGDGQPRTQVFVGGRTWDDLYDFAPLRRLSYDNPWLDVIPVVERDDTGNGGAEIGTLADVVTRYGAWADHDVTVCGSPAMIRATVAADARGGHSAGPDQLRPVHARLISLWAGPPLRPQP